MKKVSIILLSLALAAGYLFASDYVPLEKSTYLTVTDSEGNLLFVGEADDDEDSSEFITSICSGNIITTDSEGVFSSEPVLVGTEEVDGIICDVYSVNISLDESLLAGGVSTGKILGWDNVENTFDGTLCITYTVNPKTGEKLKQTASFSNLDYLADLEFEQTTKYAEFNFDEASALLPSTILTTGSYSDEDGNTVSFNIEETIKAYQVTE